MASTILNQRQNIERGHSLFSPNGRAELRMQTDGNLVLYDRQTNKPLWASDTYGKPVAFARMQEDGNFVLYDDHWAHYWASDTDGHGGARLEIQDDGNVVIYDAGHRPLWATDTYGFTSRHGFVSNLIGAIGDAGAGALHAVSGAVRSIDDALGSIPIVGGALRATFDTAGFGLFQPLFVAEDIGSGERVDRAAMQSFRRQVAVARQAAPYAQTVVSFVPGIGPVASGAISAGLALAQGQPISEAMLAAVKGALPGGALAQTAFEVGRSAIEGKSIDEIALNALPVSDQAKGAIKAGVTLAKAAADGKPLTGPALAAVVSTLPAASQALIDAAPSLAEKADAAIEEIHKLVPSDVADTVSKAINVGIAMGQARRLQGLEDRMIELGRDKLIAIGQDLITRNPIFSAQQFALTPGQKNGFAIAAALLSSNPGEYALTVARAKLSGEERSGFDQATMMQIGRIVPDLPPNAVAKPAPMPSPAAIAAMHARNLREAAPKLKRAVKVTPASAAAFHLGIGMRKMHPDQSKDLLAPVTASEEGREGLRVAIGHAQEGNRSLWKEILHVLTFGLAY